MSYLDAGFNKFLQVAGALGSLPDEGNSASIPSSGATVSGGKSISSDGKFEIDWNKGVLRSSDGARVRVEVGYSEGNDSYGITVYNAAGTAIFSAGSGVTADGIDVTELSAITANLGTVTAGSMTGVDITIGTGNNVFKADANGAYLGNATFGSAPFRVSMTGAVTASSLTLTNASIGAGSAYTGNSIAEAYIGNLTTSIITSGTFDAVRIPNLSADKITTGTFNGINMTIGSGNNVFKADSNGIYLGNATFGSAPLRVNMDGDLVASNATITGDIVTGSTVTIGTSNSIFKADSNGIYLGNATFASAPFNVSMAGALVSTSGTIAGWTVGANSLSKGTASLSSSGTDGAITADKMGMGASPSSDGLLISVGKLYMNSNDIKDVAAIYTDKVYSKSGGGTTEFQDEFRIKKDYIRLYDNGTSNFINVSFDESSNRIDMGSGSKTAIVPTTDGYRALYCMESPEVWFMDIQPQGREPDETFVEVTEGKMLTGVLRDEDGQEYTQYWRHRKGFDHVRLEHKTDEQFVANNNFWGQAH